MHSNDEMLRYAIANIEGTVTTLPTYINKADTRWENSGLSENYAEGGAGGPAPRDRRCVGGGGSLRRRLAAVSPCGRLLAAWRAGGRERRRRGRSACIMSFMALTGPKPTARV